MLLLFHLRMKAPSLDYFSFRGRCIGRDATGIRGRSVLIAKLAHYFVKGSVDRWQIYNNILH
jgi:hypothetical protein